MTSWAPSVITARTYINNRPFGIIIPDNEITSTILPIDPHNHTSSKPKIYPPNILCSQSSFKIAQFIQDINVEGLPLLILANWRGFSGGTTEMYDSVLKYGSYIVDALNKFKQNIMVYNYGEIRGGVWVVLDSSVNENISFFSSTTAIAGIVEPTAVTTVMNKLVDKVEQHLHVDHERAKQICTEFVSLHDDSRSLLRKGIIRDIVEFKKFKLYI
jgi:acetyl-CoA carboxylase/biotin carboxylase 1